MSNRQLIISETRGQRVTHAGNIHLGILGEYMVFKVMGLGEITKEVNVDR